MLRPLILLSNDEGYRARGIRMLADALRRDADVVVCAPETEQSATSHSLTLSRPLRLRDQGEGIFSIDGTPADCVYVAWHSDRRILPRAPGLGGSGLYPGLTLGPVAVETATVAA